MPTKINRAGNQQNYVPAGNGDASGEYGDNANGSNKHFKAFKKPDDSNTTANIEISTSEPKTLTKEQMIAKEREYLKDKYTKLYEDAQNNGYGYMTKMRYERYMRELEQTTDAQFLARFYDDFPEYRPKYNDFNKYIDDNTKNITEEFKKGLKESFSYGNEENKKIIFGMINNSDVKYDCTDNDNEERDKSSTYYSPLDKKVYLSKNEYDNGTTKDNYVKGEVLYHESGHAVDYNVIYEKIDGGYQYVGVLSENFKTSTGKTLKQTLMGRQKWSMSDRIEQATRDLNQFKVEWYKENKPELYENVKKLNDIQEELYNSKEYKEARNTYNTLHSKWRKTSDDYIKIQQSMLDMSRLKRNYKATEQRNLRSKLVDYDYEFEKEKNKRFGDLSDMFCMQGEGYVFGMGHKSSYAKDKNLRANEFFAECFSADATNPESVKLIKKYFPEGYKAYREIISAIKDGKIMTEEQAKRLKRGE